MVASKLVFICLASLLEACSAGEAAQLSRAAAEESAFDGEESACDGEEGESSCLLMQSASFRLPVRSPDANASSDRAAKSKSKVACFKADLKANPFAVPFSFEAKEAEAVAYIKVAKKQVDLTIDWKLPSASWKNPVIGIHIHKGDKYKNGPILVGFCGQDPLPEFTEPCEQGTYVQGYQVGGAVTEGTLAEAAKKLLLVKEKDSKFVYYLNLHTKKSFARTEALGLIRGQLHGVKCPFHHH